MGGGQYLSLFILLLVPIVRVDYNVCRRVSALPCELKIEDNPAWAWVNFGTVLVLVVSVTLTATSLACPRPSDHSRRTLFNRQATVSINTFMLVYLQHLFINFTNFKPSQPSHMSQSNVLASAVLIVSCQSLSQCALGKLGWPFLRNVRR